MCPPEDGQKAGSNERPETYAGKHPTLGYEVELYKDSTGREQVYDPDFKAYKQHKKDEVARAQAEYDAAVARNERIRQQASVPPPTAVSTAKRDRRVTNRSGSTSRRSTGYASLRVGSSGATAGPTGVNVP